MFLYDLLGLIQMNYCASHRHATRSADRTIIQSVFIRFIYSAFTWQSININRAAKLLEQEETMLKGNDDLPTKLLGISDRLLALIPP